MDYNVYVSANPKRTLLDVFATRTGEHKGTYFREYSSRQKSSIFISATCRIHQRSTVIRSLEGYGLTLPLATPQAIYNKRHELTTLLLLL